MAFRASRVTVDDTASKLVDGDDANTVTLKNRDPEESVFIGDSEVTASGEDVGGELEPGGSVAITLHGRQDEVYAVAATGIEVEIEVWRT